jgi:DNA repair ATPase RecN
VAQQKDKEEQLRKQNLDPETLQRELAELKKESQKLKDLKDLANQMGKAKDALKQGDNQMAMDQLSKAADKMREMEGKDQDLDDLRDQLKRLQDAKDSC